MKITIHYEGHTIAASLPHENADHVVTNLSACPHCASLSPVKVRGTGITSHDHDTYYADAIAICCGAPLGQMRTKVSTIFGLEEDERVLNGRARVYR